jgi:hypothetical protein
MAAGRSPHGSGDQAAAWLATVFTLTGGLFACVFVVVTSGEPPGRPMMVAIGVITILLLLLWLLRDKPPEARQESLKLWHWWKKKESETYEYKPRPRKRSHQTQYGNNQPPTLDSIREAVNDQRTWVPSIRNMKDSDNSAAGQNGPSDQPG